jgi:hypothetical protein
MNLGLLESLVIQPSHEFEKDGGGIQQYIGVVTVNIREHT